MGHLTVLGFYNLFLGLDCIQLWLLVVTLSHVSGRTEQCFDFTCFSVEKSDLRDTNELHINREPRVHLF